MPEKPSESKNTRSGKKKLRLLIEALTLFALILVAFILGGRALCKIALDQIADLTNTKITTESVEFDINCSVHISGLVIRPEHDRNNEEAILTGRKVDDAILKADTVYARFGIFSLLRVRPRLRKISVKGFVFDAQHNLDQAKWNLAAMEITPPKGGAAAIPLVHLKGGVLQRSEVSGNKRKVIAELPIDAQFGPPRRRTAKEKEKNKYEFSITTAERHALGGSTLQGFWRPGEIEVVGAISSADIPDFDEVWTIPSLHALLKYERDSDYSLELKMEDLVSEMKAPDKTFAFYKPLSTEVSGPFNAFHQFLNRYSPSGRMDIELSASGNLNRLWQSRVNGKVVCKDVSVCDGRFPYRLEHLSGRIDFTEKEVTLNNLRAEHGDVVLFVNGWTKSFGKDWQYQLRITSGNMTLDGDLHDALNEKSKKLWAISPPSPDSIAAIDHLRIRKGPNDKKEILTVKLLDAKTVFQHFPFPLTDLTGSLVFDGDTITVSNLVSRCRGWDINLQGIVTKCFSERPAYDVTIRVRDMPWDFILNPPQPVGQLQAANDANLQEFLALLPTSAKKIVSEIRPRGNIDLKIALDTTEPNSAPDYRITLQCLGNSVDFKRFSYPLRDITGRITIARDNIRLSNIKAVATDNVELTPNTSVIRINGNVDLVDNDFRRALFQLRAEDILFDERLANALPGKIRPSYSKLAPTGRFDLNFENVEVSSSDDGQKTVGFDGVLELENCGFTAGTAVSQLNAVLKTRGFYNSGDGLAGTRLEFAAETVKIKDKPFTDVKADIYYDPQQHKWQTDNLRAGCCDGIVSGKFELELLSEKPSEYVLETAFDKIDLEQFFTGRGLENNSLNGYTTGKMSGSLCVAGKAGDSRSCIGRCKLQVTDMQVGKLSPLAKLLYAVQLTESGNFAFEQMYVDSCINGEKVILQRFDLSGKAVAFNGSGWMTLPQQKINLVLTARGKRLINAEPSILGSLTEDLGQAIVRVEVTGDVSDPQVTTRALPLIKDALGLLGTKAAKSM